MSNGSNGNARVDPGERWVAPVPDDKKPRVRVAPCLGCGNLPHPDELNCLRRRVQQLLAVREQNIERCAEIAYTVNATEVFGAKPQPIAKKGKESGHKHQAHPVEWAALPDVFKAKWRKIVRAIV